MKKLFFPQIRTVGNHFGKAALSRFKGVPTFCRLGAAILFFQVHLPPLLAQEKAKNDQRIKVNFTIGPVISPVSSRIKKELKVDNAKHTPYTGMFGPSAHTNYAVRPWLQLGAEFPIKDQWSVKGALSNWGGDLQSGCW